MELVDRVIFFDETTVRIILSVAMDTDVHKCSDYMDDDDQRSD